MKNTTCMQCFTNVEMLQGQNAQHEDCNETPTVLVFLL